MTTPAIELLAKWQPDWRIAVAVDPAFSAIYEGNPNVSQILTRTGDIVRYGADITVNLHGGTRSAWMTLAQRSRIRAGFGHFRYRPLYNVLIPRAQQILGEERTVHTAEHVASAMFHLGVPRQPIPRARLYAEPVPAAEPYAVLHPFASAPQKQWPYFAELARQLPLPVRILAGPGDDTTGFAGLRIEQGSLRGAKSVLAGARLFIGNDSGPAHMAAAFGLPTVVLFGPSDEVVWAPWQTRSRVLKSVDLSKIATSDVLSAAAELLALQQQSET